MKQPETNSRRLAHAHASTTMVMEPCLDDASITSLHSPGKKLTIMIVDGDLGFLYWLGCTLSAAGYLPLPALNCEDVGGVIERLQVGVDILVIDSCLPGANELAVELTREHPQLKVIAVVRNDDKAELDYSRADAFQYKRPGSDDAMGAVWLETVRGVVAFERTESMRMRAD